MNKTIIATTGIALVAMGGMFFAYNGNIPSVAPYGEQNGTPTTMEAPLKEFVVTGDNFSFTPSTITAKKGDRVRIVFKNIQGFHDFKLDEFGAITPKIQENQDAVVEFLADKEGTFEYYCSVGKHREMGMKGTLVVK